MRNEKGPRAMPREGQIDSDAIQSETTGEGDLDSKATSTSAEVNDPIQFLKMFRPGGPWVLTAIVPDGRISTVTFRNDQLEALRAWLNAHNRRANLYFTVNETGEIRLQKKPTKNEIVGASWLHVDVDPQADEGLFDAERDRILGRLREHVPAPSLIIDSGGGYQAFWRLSETVEVDEPSQESWAEFERYNRQLETDLGGDHCHNVDRIMRPPGTINVPNKRKRAKGRQPAPTRVVHFDDQTVRLGAFGQAQVRDNRDRAMPVAVGDWSGPTDALFLCEALPPWAFRMLSDNRDANGEPFNSRSEHVWAFVGACVRDGTPRELIRWCITNPSHAVAAHILDQRDPDRAANRTIARMEAACGQE